MKRFMGLTTVTVVAALAGTACADSVTITPGAAGYQGGNGGGAFTATQASLGFVGTFSGPASNGTSNFQTFCLQLNENLGFGGTYKTVISTYTVAAGVTNFDPTSGSFGANVGQDELSATTAVLYSQFRNSGNFGGTAPADTTALVNALQLAIWYSEGELSSPANPNGLNGAFAANSDAVAMFNWAKGVAIANPNNFYGVRVLQLFNASGTNAQDLLTIVPLPPAAYAGMGTLAGVIGMGYIRRRRLANA